MLIFSVSFRLAFLLITLRGSRANQNHTNSSELLEFKGIIKDQQAKEQCEIFQRMTQRRSGFFPMRRPPPYDEAVIGCYLHDGEKCFPTGDEEEHLLSINCMSKFIEEFNLNSLCTLICGVSMHRQRRK